MLLSFRTYFNFTQKMFVALVQERKGRPTNFALFQLNTDVSASDTVLQNQSLTSVKKYVQIVWAYFLGMRTF